MQTTIKLPDSVTVELSERAQNIARRLGGDFDAAIAAAVERALRQIISSAIEAALVDHYDAIRDELHVTAVRGQVDAALAPVLAARGNGSGRPGDRGLAEMKATATALRALAEIRLSAGASFPADAKMPAELSRREETILSLAEKARVLGKPLAAVIDAFRKAEPASALEDIERDSLGQVVRVTRPVIEVSP